jgi:hypothetical protein
MVYDEVRDLIARHGLDATAANLQTYSIQSGATQSRVTVPVRNASGTECGSLHVLGSAEGDVRLSLDLEEAIADADVVTALQADIDFMLGPYEVKW